MTLNLYIPFYLFFCRSNEMSWSDCLWLGQQLINVGAYNQTKPWIKESARRYNIDEFNTNDTSLDSMEHLGENLMKIGDTDAALQIFQSVLNKNPQRLDVLSDIYENTMMLPNDYEVKGNYHVSVARVLMINTKCSLFSMNMHPQKSSNEFKLYEKVCRGEIRRSATEERQLRCRYQAANRCDFCRLAPFKVEELNLDPFIVIYHDMISDYAIKQLKESALPLMGRSTVWAGHAGTSAKRNYRISKSAWLPYETHPDAMKMLRDLRDVTGLDMSHSEQLQVANYGLGGHYEPHFDFILVS